MNKHHRTLELDRVLEMLAEQATCAASKELALRLEPCDNYRDACDALRRTADINTLTARYGTPGLGGIQDCTGALQRAKLGSRLSAGEILQVARVLRTVRTIKKWRGQGETPTAADDLFHVLAPVEGLEKDIFDAILSEEEIADAASPALNDLRRRIRRAQLKVREQLDGIIRSPQYAKALQEPIITMRDGRFVVPVKIECKNEVKGLVHDTSSSGATVFIEPMAVVDANNEIRMLQNEEQLEIDRILQEFSERIGQVADATRDSFAALLQLDLLFAKSRLADKMKATVPELNEEGIIDFRKARHPLINKEKVVPVDIRLGDGFDTLVITGPNTGGKTVALKTLGLLTLMTQCGLHIPAADRSAVSVYERVLADIGDEQSIEQSLSTFSAHMVNIVEILKEADRHSLVLFDELGAGTDPVEGAALAIAVIQHVRRLGAKVAATTHYAELKTFAMTTAGVENASCEFDVETLAPTYRLLIGIPGKSNAFAISERLGLPEEIIRDARSRVSTESASMEATIEKLEQVRQLMERDRAEAARQLREAEENRRKSERLKAELSVRLEKADEKARRDAERIIGDARRTADEVMRELDALRKMEKTDADHHRANDARAALRRKLNVAEDAAAAAAHPQPREKKVSARPVRVGDTVQLRKMGDIKATVTAISADRTLTLRAGIMNVTAKEQDVYLLENEKPEAQKFAAAHAASLRNVAAESEIDLRGMDTMEAVAATERFLDNAVMAKLEKVTIIHGKGTGALRAAVQQSLRKNKAVKSYRLGRYGEGESGVTVVELK